MVHPLNYSTFYLIQSCFWWWKIRLVPFRFLPVIKFKELISLSSLTKQRWAGCLQPFTEIGERAYSRFHAVQLITKAQREALMLKQRQIVSAKYQK